MPGPRRLATFLMIPVVIGMAPTGAAVQEIDRPRRPAEPTASPPTNLIVIQQPTPRPVFDPAYRISSYSGYGPPTYGYGGFAGFYGYPGYGYSSRYGSPAFGYGGFAGYYGYPGYNRMGPPYTVRGFGGAVYGPGIYPSGNTPGLFYNRGYGGFTPLGYRR